MDLSVVVPCRNVEATLSAQLDALLAQRWHGSWEIVVVDNGSTDATAQIVRDRMASNERLRVVVADDRAGLSYARNAGVAASAAAKLLFCDGDDVVQPGWVAALGNALDGTPLVTGALDVDLLNSVPLASSRGGGDLAPTYYDLFPVVHGCNMGMRREVFAAIGGFVEGDWPTEDRKFSFDAARHRLDVEFVPDAVVAYRYRDDARALWRQGMRYGIGRVQIASDMRSHGWPHPPRLAGWKSWVWLIRHSPAVLREAERPAWVWVAANRLGQVRGSWRYRLLLL